ncbi:MAG TPA: UDP-glucose/GDP-mannose dehydrogenase family protein [Actinomycetota bacterium]|nr:UDP-glucose/GDP-mannose dehydrogenase family protein [Actinomycetota bacterium]
MRIAIIGTGHVGLITAVGLASVGNDVVGMDLSPETVATLGRGQAPFHEPDLDRLLRDGLQARRLRFTTSVADAVTGARVVFICVGRPPEGNGDKSLSAVEEAARAVARAAGPEVVLVVKSTVPPGTTGRIGKVVLLERPDLDLVAVSNPEFLREGHAVEDTLRPDRLVVGSDDPRGFEVLRDLYAPVLAHSRLIETDPRTAELAKLASNAFLATKISFANALARVCELADADVGGVTEIMGADPRIGASFLGAGLGFGGYCLPKDIVTLERVADRLGYDFGLLREASSVNDASLIAVFRKIEEAVWNLEGKIVTLLGLAFKPGTDDVRGAPAMALAELLHKEGAHVRGVDPMAGHAASALAPWLEVIEDSYDAALGAHCLVSCTEWPQFRDLDLVRIHSLMAEPSIVDGRNVLDPGEAQAAGFQYAAVGRPTQNPDLARVPI